MEADFLIDGMLSGTGVRDAINGGYVEPTDIGLSVSLAADLAAWQKRYENAHFAGFPEVAVAKLDKEGALLTSRARNELANSRVGYFSNGLMKRLG